jgi:hypothetical protein
MPDIRLQKARATLPEGYQFGDASNTVAMRALDDSDGSRVICRTWMTGNRVTYQKSYIQAQASVGISSWNVIEGEHH